ncbi:peptidase M48, Ste24p [Sphingomonas changnyeongensis]|uniref:Peptidase M48, Ste24p n=1 Tax=Sphingomonas changnyeongensis TaxID=2698679 RepID=A0A7Z2S5G8_9SPHN|nr:M48 family metallopeptidase [Sphingomonas changnyeongensis]QHL91110.1 peptidase M48, Ste24p [Sphingomonas changnyeongensis]
MWLVLLLALTAAGPEAADPAGLRALIAEDVRVARIGDRLARAGPCTATLSSPGLIVQDIVQYAPDLRAPARAALGLGDLPTIVAVLDGSAAAVAGLRPGDMLVAIDGAAVPPADKARGFDRMAGVEAQIEAALARGTLNLGLIRDGAALTVRIGATPGCRTRFQLQPGGRLNASADGVYVQVSGALAEFAATDDELALIIAHELAHNLLGHKARLDAAGVSRGLFAGLGKGASRVRATEEEADRWALYLMARAGFDIAAAPAFWERFGRRADPGIFSDGTHDGWRTRVAKAEAEIARIRALQAAGAPILP